jgi:hypothetical protein
MSLIDCIPSEGKAIMLTPTRLPHPAVSLCSPRAQVKKDKNNLLLKVQHKIN